MRATESYCHVTAQTGHAMLSRRHELMSGEEKLSTFVALFDFGAQTRRMKISLSWLVRRLHSSGRQYGYIRVRKANARFASGAEAMDNGVC